MKYCQLFKYFVKEISGIDRDNINLYIYINFYWEIYKWDEKSV